ncbi:hypothetical protein [Prosthecobacter fusiformis]|nr:hypothetical protein [Prosthecobacter fusiformis]
MDPSPPPSSTETIVCRVTPWYFRRLGLMSGMLALMGLWFLYDWKYGYHAANKIADQKDWFEKVVLKGYDEAKSGGRLEQWVKETEAQGLPAGKNGEPPRWVSYAAEHNWPEKPHRWTDRQIRDQFWWGTCTLLVAAGVALNMFLNCKKVLCAEADRWTTPEGETVLFTQVFKVDKRKWDNKGLAYAWHREKDGTREKKAIIDDLKFDGAVRVLERLTANFQGELIEKIPEPAAVNEDDKKETE